MLFRQITSKLTSRRRQYVPTMKIRRNDFNFSNTASFDSSKRCRLVETISTRRTDVDFSKRYSFIETVPNCRYAVNLSGLGHHFSRVAAVVGSARHVASKLWLGRAPCRVGHLHRLRAPESTGLHSHQALRNRSALPHSGGRAGEVQRGRLRPPPLLPSHFSVSHAGRYGGGGATCPGDRGTTHLATTLLLD